MIIIIICFFFAQLNKSKSINVRAGLNSAEFRKLQTRSYIV